MTPYAVDPTVQVALITVFATVITTVGVIAVAIINNRKERTNTASAGVNAGLDDKDVLKHLISLNQEIDELEAQIVTLKTENRALKSENRRLAAIETGGEPDAGRPH